MKMEKTATKPAPVRRTARRPARHTARTARGGSPLWPALLGLQILFLAVLTFSAGGHTLDGDAAKVCAHLRGIWESGSLLVPDWQYITTMELDCALLPALPFYGLTHDPVLAFHLADLVLIGCWVGVILLLFRRLGEPVQYGCLACLLVLLPYEFAMLGYWNMMFLNAAQYGLKVLLPLLLAALLLDARRRPSVSAWVLLGLLLAGVLCTSFSSGVYVAGCGLAPVLAAAAWKWLRGRLSLTLYRGCCAGGTLAAALAGLGLNAALDIHTKGNAMTLITADQFWGNAGRCLAAFFRLFGGLPGSSVEVLSAAGISALLRLLLAAALVAGAVCLPRAMGVWKVLPEGAVFLGTIFWWNLAVLLLTDTTYGDPFFEYRYHLMGAVPLLLLLALWAQRWPLLQPGRLRAAAALGGSVLVAVLAVVCDADAAKAIDASTENEAQYALCQAVEGMEGIQDVFVEYNAGGAEICAALDGDHRYIIYMANMHSTLTYDGYLADTDATAYQGPALLALPTGAKLEDNIQSYLAGQFRFVSTVGGYDLYRCDTAPLLDGAVGLAFGSRGLDYCDSYEYQYAGTMDQRRHLLTDPIGGTVVERRGLELCRTASITLDYTVTAGEGQVGSLELWQGDKRLASAPLESGGSTATLTDLPAGEGYTLKVTMNPDATADLGSFLFEAQ